MKNLTTQFGYHLTLDFYGCEKDKLADMNYIYDTFNELVKLLDMKALMPPFIINAESNEALGGKDPGGITGYIVIAESHISIHTFTRRGFISMDLYSCKFFDYDRAIQYLKGRFNPKDLEINKIDRGTKYPVENIY